MYLDKSTDNNNNSGDRPSETNEGLIFDKRSAFRLCVCVSDDHRHMPLPISMNIGINIGPTSYKGGATYL